MITGISRAQAAEVVEKEQEVNGVIRRGQQLSVQGYSSLSSWKDLVSYLQLTYKILPG